MMTFIFFLFVFLFLLTIIGVLGFLAFAVPIEMLRELTDINNSGYFTKKERLLQIIIAILGFPFFGTLTILLIYFNFTFIMDKI